MNLPEHTSRIDEIEQILSWKAALNRLEPAEQKPFIMKRYLDGHMTQSITEQLFKILMLESE